MATTTAPSTALAWTQYVSALILIEEAAIATPQAGATKLQNVLNGIQAASMVGMLVAPNQTVANWTALIGGIVAAFNASGIFTKTAPVA